MKKTAEHDFRALLLCLTIFIGSAAADTCLVAQSSASRPAAGSGTIPALFLSDIHFDPFHDPGKVKLLNGTPVAGWASVLSLPDSPTQAADSAALQQTCPVRGTDTSDALWQSSLQAMRTRAMHVSFVTVSGDLLAHAFDCKYKTLVPNATHADYLEFIDRTLRYIVSGLRTALPGVPIYVALGNNDSGCGDYQLDYPHDRFLARTAEIVAEAAQIPAANRGSLLRDFAAGGYYSVQLPVPNTRLLVVDDLYASTKYATCAGQPNRTPAPDQLEWLAAQIEAATQSHEHVWVLGHIPPGVDLYSTARKLTNICGGARPQMFLSSEKIPALLAANSATVSLALFGHTHADEMRLLTPEGAGPAAGVPVKLVASISPVNGNNPSFTLASIDPASATLRDYTVVQASNLSGAGAKWAVEYTYSTTYHEPSFSPAALADLIGRFHGDPGAVTPASQAYLHNYTGTPADTSRSAILRPFWPQYVCAMNHDSPASFAACACNLNP